jgi:hypothetical protein
MHVRSPGEESSDEVCLRPTTSSDRIASPSTSSDRLPSTPTSPTAASAAAAAAAMSGLTSSASVVATTKDKKKLERERKEIERKEKKKLEKEMKEKAKEEKRKEREKEKAERAKKGKDKEKKAASGLASTKPDQDDLPHTVPTPLLTNNRFSLLCFFVFLIDLSTLLVTYCYIYIYIYSFFIFICVYSNVFPCISIYLIHTAAQTGIPADYQKGRAERCGERWRLDHRRQEAAHRGSFARQGSLHPSVPARLGPLQRHGARPGRQRQRRRWW